MKIKPILVTAALLASISTVNADETHLPDIAKSLGVTNAELINNTDLKKIRAQYWRTAFAAWSDCARGTHGGCKGRNKFGRSADYPGLWFSQFIVNGRWHYHSF